MGLIEQLTESGAHGVEFHVAQLHREDREALSRDMLNLAGGAVGNHNRAHKRLGVIDRLSITLEEEIGEEMPEMKAHFEGLNNILGGMRKGVEELVDQTNRMLPPDKRGRHVFKTR